MQKEVTGKLTWERQVEHCKGEHSVPVVLALHSQMGGRRNKQKCWVQYKWRNQDREVSWSTQSCFCSPKCNWRLRNKKRSKTMNSKRRSKDGACQEVARGRGDPRECKELRRWNHCVLKWNMEMNGQKGVFSQPNLLHSSRAVSPHYIHAPKPKGFGFNGRPLGCCSNINCRQKNQIWWKYPGLGLGWEAELLGIAQVCRGRKL